MLSGNLKVSFEFKKNKDENDNNTWQNQQSEIYNRIKYKDPFNEDFTYYDLKKDKKCSNTQETTSPFLSKLSTGDLSRRESLLSMNDFQLNVDNQKQENAKVQENLQAETDEKAENNIKGSLLVMLVAFISSLLLVNQKLLFKDYSYISFGQQNIFRGIAFMMINYMIIRNKQMQITYDKDTTHILVKRIVAGYIGSILINLSTNYLRVNTANVIYNFYGVMCCLIAGIVLNEIVTRRDIFFIMSFFLSACMIIKPFFGEGEDSLVGIILGIGGALGYCFMAVNQKFLKNKVEGVAINFYFGIAYLVGGIINHFLLGNQSFVFTFQAFSYLLFLGCLQNFNWYLYILAINSGKVSYILPFENTNVVFSLLLGQFILHESCDFLDVTGTLCIVIICVMRSIIMMNEGEKNKQITKEDLHADHLSRASIMSK